MFIIPKLITDKSIADTKVMVAMSGGVDSSTVAAYLHKLGYQVVGVTLQLYKDTPAKNGKTCCAGRDIYDAKRLAENFGFPHYVMNYEEIFKNEVIDPFIESYLKGETPVPCITCNQTVKFRDLFGVAKTLNVDALATGHYIKRVEDNVGNTELHKAKDANKDQSYFLFSINKEQLDFLRFPLGDFTKNETRELARELGVSIADKPESQDICFVKNTYANLIENMRPNSSFEGDIVNSKGEVLGKHNGITNYTVGQRQGLGISYPEPLYVLKINARNNTIIVGIRDELEQKIFFVKKVNWLLDSNFSSIDAEVKVRSGAETTKAIIHNYDDDTLKIELTHASKTAVAPGQACVFYQGTRVLGGGWIKST